jgi:hypothetical protein
MPDKTKVNAPEMWSESADSLQKELDRLGLSELVADSIEDYSLTDGYYQILLRLDDVEKLRDKLSKLRAAPPALPTGTRSITQERGMPDAHVLNGKTAKVLANMMKRHLPRFAEVEVVPHEYRSGPDYSDVTETYRLHVYYPLKGMDPDGNGTSVELRCVYTFDLREGVTVEHPRQFVLEYQEEASRLNEWHDDVILLMSALNN